MPYLKKRKAQNTIYKNRDFPQYIKKYRPKNRVALIGVGGNLGDVKRRFKHLLEFLKRDRQIRVLTTSIVLKNPPFGYLEQDDFYNTLFLIETKFTPLELLRYLQRVEKHFKRDRLFKNGPRTLDLDIIFYEKIRVRKGEKLIIPHPYWQERDSVKIPLSFLKGRKCLKRVL